MEKAELIKLIFAAVIGVVVKELLTWLIKRTTPVAATFGARIITWLKNNPRLIGLSIEALILGFMFWIVLFSGDDSKPTSLREVRSLLGGYLILIIQFSEFSRHFHEVRDLYRKRKQEVSAE